MMKRMWIGVLLMFLHESVSLIISDQIEHTTLAYEFYDEQRKPVLHSSPEIRYYSLIQFANNTEWYTTDCAFHHTEKTNLLF